MLRLLLFTTMMACALSKDDHLSDFIKNRVVPYNGLARNRVPWEDYFDFARNRVNKEAFEPTILKNKDEPLLIRSFKRQYSQVVPLSHASLGEHDRIVAKDMCMFVVSKLMGHMPFREEELDEVDEGDGSFMVYDRALLNTDAVDSVTKAKILAEPATIVEDKVYTEGLRDIHTPLHHTAKLKKIINVEDAPLFNVPGIHKDKHRTATIEKVMHVNDAPLFNVPGIQKILRYAAIKKPFVRLAKTQGMGKDLMDVCEKMF